jgi:spore maturation protein CgeB
MKILILCAGDTYTLGWSYRRGFESAGCQVSMIDPGQLLDESPLWRNHLSRRLFERSLIAAFNRRWLAELVEVEADAVWIGKGAWSVPWLWAAYKQARPATKLICYNADDPITTYSRGGNRPWVSQAIPCFDLFCTYNGLLVEPIRAAGARRVLRLPFAWDPAIHPMQPQDGYDHDVVFVGNADAYREEWLTNILKVPSARDWRMAVFGLWQDVADPVLAERIQHRQVVGGEMAQVLARSKVALNVLRRQNEGSHNMRTFETPGCGGLMASQYSAEQDAVFPVDEAAIYFTTPKEAVSRIDRVLSNDALLDRLRQGARERVQTQTYGHRAAVILEHL